MCITITAAQECFACHSMEMLQILLFFFFFSWEGAEFNLHFVTSFHPISTAMVSVNTGIPILLQKKNIGKIYLSNIPFLFFVKSDNELIYSVFYFYFYFPTLGPFSAIKRFRAASAQRDLMV